MALWLALSLTGVVTAAPLPAKHVRSTPGNVVWGEFVIDRPPVLTVPSGGTVTIDTLSHQGATQDEDPITFLGEIRREERRDSAGRR